MSNQASEDEPTKSKVNWSTPYDEWLIPILNRFRYGGAIECRAIPSEIQLNIEALIRNEKLKLLNEVVHQSTVNLKSAKAVAGWAELRKKQLEAEL